MAENSIREQLILSDIAIAESISAISVVVRTIQTYSDLQSFAITQFPVAAIVGRLPIPANKFSGRIKSSIDQVISNLRVDLYVYFMNNENSDSMLSNLLDDMWVALHTNPTRNNLCLTTRLEMTEDIQIYAPYGAFRITCVHEYKHDTGGI